MFRTWVVLVIKCYIDHRSCLQDQVRGGFQDRGRVLVRSTLEFAPRDVMFCYFVESWKCQFAQPRGSYTSTHLAIQLSRDILEYMLIAHSAKGKSKKSTWAFVLLC
jgi:hypothetical protein